VEYNLAARSTVSPGKARMFILLEERHGKSLIIEKRDSAAQEIVVANIAFADWR
jgi:hypothetical protein